jgi:hypothetical protein
MRHAEDVVVTIARARWMSCGVWRVKTASAKRPREPKGRDTDTRQFTGHLGTEDGVRDTFRVPERFGGAWVPLGCAIRD